MSDKEYGLSILGTKVAQPQHPDEAKLERIPYHWKGADVEVNLICEEFTCVCPITGQPDFAKILINYTPANYLVESKALKLYLGSYRNVGTFHEFVVTKISRDLILLLDPQKIEVRGEFSVRGGIRIHPVVRWQQGQKIPELSR